MKNSAKFKSTILWLAICTFLAGVPALIIFSTISRHLSLNEKVHQRQINSELKQAIVQARLNVDQETFWCKLFAEQYLKFEKEKVPAEKVEKWMANARHSFNNDFNYLCWDNQGNTLKRTFASEHSEDEWKEVFKTLATNFAFHGNISYSRKYKPNIEVTRKVLGQQYIPKIFLFNFESSNHSLAWTDSSMKRPLYFAFFLNDCAYLITIDEKKLHSWTGIKNYIENVALTRSLKMGIFEPGQPIQNLWKTSQEKSDEELLSLLNICEKKSLSFFEDNNDYIFYQYLSPKLRLFIHSEKIYTRREILGLSLLGAAIFLALMIPVFIYTWKTVALNLPGDISIRWKLAFLFLFASGIPLMALAIISQENHTQKRAELMNQAQKETTEMVLSFDKRFVSYLAGLGQEMKKFFEDFEEKIENNASDDELQNFSVDFIKSRHSYNFYIISSDTPKVYATSGFFKLQGSLESAKIDELNSKPAKPISSIIRSDLSSANLVGKKVLADLNDTPFPLATISKLEIVAETLMQRPFIEIIHSIVSNFNSLSTWGFGRVQDYGFSNLLTVNNSNQYDYIGMVFWQPHVLQTHFLNSKLSQASRNSRGIKIIAIDKRNHLALPNGATPSSELAAFSKMLAERPNEDIQVITFENKRYIAVGFNAKELSTYQLIGLYPLAEIERTIQLQRTELILFGIFCILFSIGLAQILFRSFLRPIDALKNGALAIELRDFEHRIAIQNKDEFGQIASIFNNVMVGFEELEVAKIVQDSLFPEPAFNQGKFRVYGKSIAMSELGGDYFDFIEIDEQCFGILMGDVAGHGVGAAVIMAMAKAGILSSADKLNEPAELMLNLHKMILAAKSAKQRKVMTFQYLYLNCFSGEGVYSNAGGCSPMSIKNNGQEVHEISLPGPALGGFKKAKYQNCAMNFSHGDAVVFYTDGIVETRNPDGEEIGYEGFKAMLLKAWDMDPEKFYNNVLVMYNHHLGGQEAQDDLTFLVMVCDESQIEAKPGSSAQSS